MHTHHHHTHTRKHGVGEIIIIIISLFVLFMSFITFLLLNQGMNRSEEYDCLKLEKMSNTYPNFYLTQWQDDMCKAHNIIINAPVK